ncbi:microtubule-associated protein tau-like [Centruroides sculpturatus]|uniref:microtubule-associated protein tau-like n=1 Tax=Centruroides sculpturatus TaxID=218467 RepID=UPI000C6E692C|nr:microtubule-associated protein tau-like [Centruroides sculpturatus]
MNELPPIKAPVGQAPNPNLKNVKSKIGSLDNIKHKPGGGERKVASQKLEWQASSKIGSLEKASHKPGGGDKKILVQKLDFKDKAQSKVGSRDNIKHQPGGGTIKKQHVQAESGQDRIETQKTDFKQRASSKVGSLDNIKHQAGGGNVKIRSDKLNFKERASSKIGSLSGSEKGSTHGSDSQSPIPPSSPTPGDEPGTSMPPVSENGEENGISPTEDRQLDGDASPESPEALKATSVSPQAAQC